jgi:hypothetical protein
LEVAVAAAGKWPLRRRERRRRRHSSFHHFIRSSSILCTPVSAAKFRDGFMQQVINRQYRVSPITLFQSSLAFDLCTPLTVACPLTSPFLLNI